MGTKIAIIGVVVAIIIGLSTTVYIQKLKLDNLNQQLLFQETSYNLEIERVEKEMTALEKKKQEVITKYEYVNIGGSSCTEKINEIDTLLDVFDRGN